MPGMSPAFFFVQQVEAWQFEAFFALVIITNSVFIGVAQLQPTTVGTGSGPTPVGLGWLRWRLDVGRPEVTIQLESLEDSVYDAWPRPRPARWRLEGNGVGWSIFLYTWDFIRCVKCWVWWASWMSHNWLLLSLNKIVLPCWVNTLHFSFRVQQYFLVLELKQGKWRWLFVFLPWGDFIPRTDGWYSDNINALFHTKTVQWSILKEPIYWICSFIENLYRLMQNPPKPAVNLGLLSPWERKTHLCLYLPSV